MELSLIARFRDYLSRPGSQALRKIADESKATGRAVDGLDREVTQLGRNRGPDQLLERLRQITRESRAAERALGAAAKAGRGLQAAGQAYGAGAAGVMAGAAVARRPISETMSYDRRLALMANTAYSDRDLAGRKAGMRELDMSVRAAIRDGGGTREGAAETLNSMVSAGTPLASAMKMLPSIMKSATSEGADPAELAAIAVRAKQAFKIADKDMPLALDMAIKAGQMGGFELRDMSKWLPAQMAVAGQAGMYGLAGFGKLLAANQASYITAGTKDAAGNNLANLLGKLTSQDTAKDAARLGLDLSGTLTKARGQGVDALDAFAGMVNQVVSRDPEFLRLRTAAANLPDGAEKKAVMESQAKILEGTAVGQLIQDSEALRALVGFMNNRDYVRNIEKQLPGAGGTGARNFALIRDTDSYQVERLKNEKTIAEQDATSGINKALGGAAGVLADYAQSYPGLTQAIVGTTNVLNALAAAAAGFGVANFLMKRAGGKAGAAALGEAAAGGAGSRALLARAGSLVPKGAGLLALGTAGVEAWDIANSKVMTRAQKQAGLMRVEGGAAGALAGAAFGAGVGSVIPVAGTAIGAGIGGLLGFLGGGKLGELLGDALYKAEASRKPAQINNQVSVVIDGREIAAVVNQLNAVAGRRS